MDVVSSDSKPSTEAVEGVHLTLLAGGDNANFQGVTLEPGATVPEHDHPHEQLGLVVEGTLTLIVEGEEYDLGPGDTYRLTGGEPHAAANRGEDPVVAYDVFSPPRDDPDWLE